MSERILPDLPHVPIGAAATVALSALFPLLFWWGQAHASAQWVAVVPLLSLLARGTTHWRRPAFGCLVVGVIVLVAATWYWNVATPLKAYPALISACLLVAFGTSLVYPPTMVEQIARVAEPHLSALGVQYTRRVTELWCVFFVVNMSVSLVTAFAASDRVWLWYNGCVSYALIALLYAAEWSVRQRVKGRHAQTQ